MDYLEFVKKYVAITALFSMGVAAAAGSDYSAIIGGNDNTDLAYAALIPNGSSTPAPVSLPGLQGTSYINSVAMNAAGQAIVGGLNNTNLPYAALLNSGNLSATQINFVGSTATNNGIQSVAINNLGQAILGGQNNTNIAYAARIAPGSSTPIPVTLPGLTGLSNIDTVAINNFGQAIVGGSNNNSIYAALIPAGSTTGTLIPLPTFTGNSTIASVALNDAGQAIIGGQATTLAYAAIIPAGSTTATQVTLPGIGSSISVYSVAINSAGQSIVGAVGPYVGLIPPGSFTAQQVTLSGFGGAGGINAVAINTSGAAIVGGGTSSSAYVGIIPAGSTTATPITLPDIVGISTIHSVAINDFGQGIVGGETNGDTTPYAALIAPGITTAIPITLPTSAGNIASVAMFFFSQIPTAGLSGNNLAFANYINNDSPYQAFYFIPAIMDGTLSQALESAAPTRNAFSLWAADNNLFSFDTALSSHSALERLSRRKPMASSNIAALEADQLMVSNKQQAAPPPKAEEKPYEIWVTFLGTEAYQKKEHQAPAFNPASGGLILGFDGKVTTNSRLGAGFAYAYTHLRENEGAGHSNINQEYLFLYSMWDTSHLYIDSALWGGLFQIDNTRNIHMTGFDFKSTSHPNGGQFSPHFEMGYTFYPSSQKWAVEPFVMFDWVGNWQSSYKEKGSGPFNVGQKHHFSSFLRSELSTRFYQTLFYTNWNVSFEEKLGYVNKKPFNVGTVNAFLVGSPGSFTVETLTTTQNLGVAQLQFLLQPKNGSYPMTTLLYQGEFGSQYQSHTVSLELNWKF